MQLFPAFVSSPGTASFPLHRPFASTDILQLSYTRGTSIPIFLTISGHDEQAVALLSSPQAPVVKIRRKTKAHLGVDDTGPGLVTGNEQSRPLSEASWKVIRDCKLMQDGTYEAALYGEISLPVGLVPSFKFGEFEVTVCVYAITLILSYLSVLLVFG